MRIFLAVAIVLLCVSTLDASSIYRKAESNAATNLVRRDQISQNKQVNQNGRNIADQALNGSGNQIEQNQQNNLYGDNISNKVQSSYWVRRTIQDKQLNQIGKNVENQALYGNENQRKPNLKSNLYGGNLSNQVQDSPKKNVNVGDNSRFNTAMQSDAYNSRDVDEYDTTNNSQFGLVNEEPLDIQGLSLLTNSLTETKLSD